MCGIVGICGQDSKLHSRVQKMTSVLHHRGPDDEGFYFENNIVLGMKRLAIIDLKTGHQPVFNEDRSVVVILNGEIYNYKALRSELEDKGHQFSTHSDTETIVHLYEEYGEECVHHLRGMFAFAVWDKRKKLLFLARDRLGIKPLYYTFQRNKLLFSSELKALLASGLVDREINTQDLNHFLSFYAVPAPYTMLKDVYALPPGHVLMFNNSNYQIKKYWDLNFNPSKNTETMDEYEIEQHLWQLLRDTVNLHLQSDVPYGAFLSGGLDSSTVVGIMTQLVSDPIKTFSIGFGKEGANIDELNYARIVAERFQTSHSEVIIGGKDIFDHLDHIILSLDQPSGDAINTYFVSKAARNGVTVALSGLGGDELFAGYYHFRIMNELSRYDSLRNHLPAIVRRMIQPMSLLPDFLQKLGPFYRAAKIGTAMHNFLGRYSPLAVKLFDEKTKHRLVAKGFKDKFSNSEGFEAYLNRYIYDDEMDVIDKVSRVKLQHYMAHTLLRDTDVMSMAHSLEVRVPLIDHKVVEFVASLPSSYKWRNGISKYILKRAVRDILPVEIIEHSKQGFLIPMNAWLHSDLKPVVDDVFSRSSVEKRGIFKYKELNNIYQKFYNRNSKIAYHWIWSLVVLELWMRRYLDESI